MRRFDVCPLVRSCAFGDWSGSGTKSSIRKLRLSYKSGSVFLAATVLMAMLAAPLAHRVSAGIYCEGLTWPSGKCWPSGAWDIATVSAVGMNQTNVNAFHAWLTDRNNLASNAYVLIRNGK